jgi:hypothetical protein
MCSSLVANFLGSIPNNLKSHTSSKGMGPFQMSALSPKIDLKIWYLVEFKGILCEKMAQICLWKNFR